MSQMKEQGTNLQDQQNEEEIGNLPEKEFRVMIVKMIQNLRNRMEAQIEKIQEMLNKDLEMKNTLQGINNRITKAEEIISELEDGMVEITAKEQNKEKRMKRIEDNIRDLWDNTKCTHIRIIGVPEEEEKKKRIEKIFEEIIVENFPNMGKEIVTQVQEKAESPIQDEN